MDFRIHTQQLLFIFIFFFKWTEFVTITKLFQTPKFRKQSNSSGNYLSFKSTILFAKKNAQQAKEPFRFSPTEKGVKFPIKKNEPPRRIFTSPAPPPSFGFANVSVSYSSKYGSSERVPNRFLSYLPFIQLTHTYIHRRRERESTLEAHIRGTARSRLIRCPLLSALMD